MATMIQSLMALKAHKEINMLSAIKSANLTDIGVGTASGTGFELSWRFGRIFGAFRGSGLRVRIPNKRAWRPGLFICQVTESMEGYKPNCR